ncbi:MAG: DUF3458 domain-containing protein [Aridibacter famidurans]|nr:DUF3458 domain-containing protein [Aridibacter famidurans]
MKFARQPIIRSAIAAVFVFAVSVSAAIPVSARPLMPFRPAFQDDQKVLPPTQYIRSRDFDTKHISLDLRFNWDTEQTIGIEEFTFSPLKDGFTDLVLDAALMEFGSVRIKDGEDLAFDYDEENSKLTIRFEEPMNRGDDLTVVIEYTTKGTTVPSGLGFGGGGGLKFIKPTAKDPTRPMQIWSQGETEYNRYWFPSYDYPNDFRTTELKATVKKPLTVISNGALVETKENTDGTRTFHWKMDTPYTNYLTSIVVGEYTEVKGNYLDVPISTWVYPQWKRQGEVTAKRLPAMVKFYSEKLGIKYPYSKYAQTIAYEFGGGMENITATTQTDEMIIDERTELDTDWDGLQAHELVHQWFGNWVTCRDWSEIWLNESFATYLEALWMLESKGKDEFLWNEVKGSQDQYFGAWNQGNRRPIVTKNYANPDAVFDSYAYPRGGAVLHMLRKQLGDANFWRSISHYLRSNSNQPVSTEDLRIAIEETTGQSMDAFFDQWLYRMGHPIFEVSKSWDRDESTLKLTVKQAQVMDVLNPYPQVRFFRTPVDIEIVTQDGKRVETVYVEAKDINEFTFEDVDSEPLLVDFDNEGTLIKEVRFEKSTEELVYQLRNDNDVLGRRWALERLTEAAGDDSADSEDRTKILSELRASAESDPFWRMRREAISSLRALLVPEGEPGVPVTGVDLDAETRAVLARAADDDSSLVRTEAIAMLGTTSDEAFVPKYVRAIASDRSYEVVTVAANALAKTKDKGAYAILWKLAQTESWRDNLMVAGLNALVVLGDRNALDLGYKFGAEKAPPSPRKTAALNVIAEYGKGDPRAFPLIFDNFKQALESSDFNGIFSGFEALIKLGDPRGQEAFDLAKEKFGSNQNLVRFIGQFEERFKKSVAN